jgi:hypothetical protein
MTFICYGVCAAFYQRTPKTYTVEWYYVKIGGLKITVESKNFCNRVLINTKD